MLLKRCKKHCVDRIALYTSYDAVYIHNHRRLIDALKKADSVLKLTKTIELMRSGDHRTRHDAICSYTRLTDCVVERIKDSTDPGLKKVS